MPPAERHDARAAIPDAPDTGPATVRPVDVTLVRPLRIEVLRPGRPPEASVLPGDDHPLARHVAVYLDGDVVSVGTVFPDPAPWKPERGDAWRVRGMATRDGLRGRRLGHLVLSALIDHATANGGRFIWCEARIGATGFYARSGFVVEGESFILEEIEHFHMWRDL
jgi:predicted GNAT family N-acyltransferase